MSHSRSGRYFSRAVWKSVLVSRSRRCLYNGVVLPRTSSGAFALQALLALREFLGGQVDDMERVHDLSRRRESMVTGGVAVTGEPVALVAARIQWRNVLPQAWRQSPTTSADRPGTMPIRPAGPTPSTSGVISMMTATKPGDPSPRTCFHLVAVDAGYPDPVKSGGVGVGEVPVGCQGQLVGLVPADTQGPGVGFRAPAVDGQSLQDPAGHSTGRFAPASAHGRTGRLSCFTMCW